MPLNGDRAEIIRVLRAYHKAMVEARTDALGDIVDEGFSLVHITGYIQPGSEWFGVIRSGQFDYHSIDVDEQALSISYPAVRPRQLEGDYSTPLSTASAALGHCSSPYGSPGAVMDGGSFRVDTPWRRTAMPAMIHIGIRSVRRKVAAWVNRVSAN